MKHIIRYSAVIFTFFVGFRHLLAQDTLSVSNPVQVADSLSKIDYDSTQTNSSVKKPLNEFMLLGENFDEDSIALPGLKTQKSTQYQNAPTTIVGIVRDATTGDPMPFVNVFFQGTTIGTTTDFEGNFTLKTSSPTDSLSVSFVGYITKSKSINPGSEQNINFQMQPTALSLNEVVIYSGENPAYPIMRKVIKKKPEHDKKKLSAYEYESYNKIEIDIDNISEKFRNRKIMRKIDEAFDSLKSMAGEDGKTILPVFISESLSKYYKRTSPEKSREYITNTKLTGVGLDDGSFISQLIGSSFQQYNFYNNWIDLLNKNFVSPIADSWKTYYKYYLTDSMYVGSDWCFKIEIEPRNAQELAFSGVIWITADDYALKQVDLTVSPKANINFVERIKIQQEMQRVDSLAWLPAKTRILVDVSEITKNTAGMLAKFYSSNKNFVINQPKEPKFYDVRVELAENALEEPDKTFWQRSRHDTLSNAERRVYTIIDSLRNLPTIKTYVEIANILINGYKKIGPVDVGPYLLLYANNTIEGHRFRVGFRTNEDFSKKWILSGFGAYGTRDKAFKYGTGLTYIASRKPWTTLTLEHKQDIDIVGFMEEDIGDNMLLLTSVRFGKITRPFKHTRSSFTFQTELFRDFTPKIIFRNRRFEPLYNFGYYRLPDSTIETSFNTSELIVEARYARNELFVINGNQRISLGTDKWPVFTLRYIRGFNGLFGSNLNYQKFSLNISQKLRMGVLGYSNYSLTAGYIPSTIPYPLLQNHLGNNTFFYNALSFNLMNVFEFVSDRYISFSLKHHFEGFFFNRIPLLKRLHWRFLVTSNILFGSLRHENRDIIPTDIETFSSLDPSKPYIELGYGIENIFRFIRIDAIHRVTYLDRPNVRRFGVRFSANFTL